MLRPKVKAAGRELMCCVLGQFHSDKPQNEIAELRIFDGFGRRAIAAD